MKRILAISIGLLVVLSPMGIVAAERQMEEIVVTATKREMSIQDVPIAVSAFAGEDLAARGVIDLYGLQEVSPSISVYSSNSTSNGGTVRIRGVGTTGNNPGLEAAVGTFIDGVYRSRAGQAFTDLVDIERIEILRGPQGTLFGKNTSAGALQIITKKPEFEQKGFVSVSGGDFGLVKAQASITGPFSDTVAYRLAVSYHDRDGWYEDDFTGDAYDRRDRFTIKGQLLFTPSDSFSTRIIYDYTEKDEDCCPANYEFINFTEFGPSATTGGLLTLGEPPGVVVNDLLAALGRPLEFANFPSDDYEVGVNFKPFEEVEDWGIQNQATWDINDNMRLVSITAYREFDVDRGQDIDFSGADILQPQFTVESFENFSQEFQVTYTTDNADYLFGAYYYTEDIVTDEAIRLAAQGPLYAARYILGGLDGGCKCGLLSAVLTGPPFGMTTGAALGTFNAVTGQLEGGGVARPNFAEGDGYRADYTQDTDGWSVFTHNVFHLTDRMDLIVGARYSNETKDATTRINGVNPVTTDFGPTGTRDLLAAMLRDEFNEDHCLGVVFLGFACNLVSWTDESTEKEWTGTIKLAYALTDEMNVYVSFARGYKAGGFNLDQQAIEMDSLATYQATGGIAFALSPDKTFENIPQKILDATGGTGRLGLTQFACGQKTGVTNPSIDDLDCAFFDDDHAFDPEFVDAYEIGLKTRLLDGNLTVNVALFHSDFEDFQLNTFTGVGFLISNTEEMISRGVEIESTWFIGENLLWSFGVTYADAKYGDSLNSSTNDIDLFLAQDYKTLEDWRALESIEGRQITHAPYWQGSTSLFYERQFGSVMGYGNINVGFRGAHNTGSDLKNEKDVSDKALINLQVGIRAPSDRWDIQIWARNLADKQIDALVFNSVFQGGSFSTFLAPPRMVGVTLATRW